MLVQRALSRYANELHLMFTNTNGTVQHALAGLCVVVDIVNAHCIRSLLFALSQLCKWHSGYMNKSLQNFTKLSNIHRTGVSLHVGVL